MSIKTAGNIVRSLLVMFALVPLWLTACPKLPPPDGCTPGAYSCGQDDRPMYCSPSQRNTPIGDLPCNAQGARCVVSNGAAHCEQVQSVAQR